MRSMQGNTTLGDAFDLLSRASCLKIPYSTNILELLNNTPALLPLLSGTEYQLDNKFQSCDLLFCLRLSDLMSLVRSLKPGQHPNDKFISEISRICRLCAGNVDVLNMFDHIWFECDAVPTSALSLFLGIDSEGGMWSVDKELSKMATALNLLDSMYGVQCDRTKLFNIGRSMVEGLGRGTIYEVGFMGRSQKEAHVKLLISPHSSYSQENFIGESRYFSSEIDTILKHPKVRQVARAMIDLQCTVNISVSVYASRQKFAVEFKPLYDPSKSSQFDNLWSQVRDSLKLSTYNDCFSLSMAEAHCEEEGIRLSSRLHHIKFYLKETGDIGTKVYRDFRVTSLY